MKEPFVLTLMQEEGESDEAFTKRVHALADYAWRSTVQTSHARRDERERDTKFAGFAELLNEDMHNRLDFWIDTSEPNFTEELLLIIAQRAYDLAVHVIHMTQAIDKPGEVRTPGDILRQMPDIPALPQE